MDITINDVRPSVLNAALLMEKVLRSNEYKGGWDFSANHYLMSRFFEEVNEVKSEWMEIPYSKILTDENFNFTYHDFEVTNKLAIEIIDVMNFGMMLLDNMQSTVKVECAEKKEIE